MIKGLIFDIRRFSVHDGPGIRTTVFFKGCPLQCWWCHNPESRLPEPETSIRHRILDNRKHDREEVTGVFMSAEEVTEEAMKDFIFFDESGGGVTLSGGEPLFQPEFLQLLLRRLKGLGVQTAVDTCGFAPTQEFENIIPYTDLFLYDLKHPDEEEHIRYTGVSNSLIHDNLQFLLSAGKKVILRLPIVPGINDQPRQTGSLLSFLQSFNPSILRSISEIHLLPYHSIAQNKYRRFKKENRLEGIKEMSKEELLPLRKNLERAGFKVKTGG